MKDLLIFLISFIFLLLIWFHLKLTKSRHFLVAKQIPGPYIYPLLGNGIQLMGKHAEQLFNYIRELPRKYNCSVRLFIFGELLYHIVKAEDCEVILTCQQNIDKSDLYLYLHPFIGTGLLCSSGMKWAQRRKILTPAFHFNILKIFLKIFREESQKFVNRIKELYDEDEVNLSDVIPIFTLNTVCETSMGVKLDLIKDSDKYRENVLKIGEWIVFCVINAIFHFRLVCKICGITYILNKYVKPVHKLTSDIISQRRIYFRNNLKNSGTDDTMEINENIYIKTRKRYAMLDTLLSAEMNGNQIDEEGIQEEVSTFIFEGFDTTSIAITFILFMLGTHIDIQNKVYQEILEIIDSINNNKDEPSITDYGSMKYLERVIKESLRLYPPVPFIGRKLTEPLKIGNIELPIDTQISINIYDIHRDPEQFRDPERFDPDRFLPENSAKRHIFSYIPFSAGPRNCIGQKFAMLEMKTLIVKILLNYQLEAITSVDELVFSCDLVLTTKHPIKIRFVKRQ